MPTVKFPNRYTMYSISMHIEYLLLRHDCVVVPGFGAFINVRHAARYDEGMRCWLPMTREVRFNGSLKHDDGLLANSFARKNEISFETGRNLLEKEIKDLRHQLEEDGEVTIGNLGILHMDSEEGSVTFIPSHSAMQQASAMGLLEAPIAKRQQQESVKKDAATDKATSETTTGKSDESTEGGSYQTFNTTRNYYLAINKIFAKAAAGIAIIVAIALSVLIPVSDCNRENRASVVPAEELIVKVSEKSEDALRPIQEESGSAEKEELDKAPAKSRAKYHAIVATFTNEDDAERYVSQHKDSGYILGIITTKTKSRVTAMSSDNIEELRARMSNREFREAYGEAWIWSE